MRNLSTARSNAISAGFSGTGRLRSVEIHRVVKRSFATFAFAGLPGPATLSCGGDDEVRNTVDCAEICGRFSECVTDIDVTACTDECEDRADADDLIADRADACEECIRGRSCAEAASCWSDCPVVPAQD